LASGNSASYRAWYGTLRTANERGGPRKSAAAYRLRPLRQRGTLAAVPLWFWIAFHVGVVIVLAIDLVGFNRKAHVISIREATIWSVVWVTLSLSFNALVWHLKGPQAALEFFTGYLIEYSLSVDNIFVSSSSSATSRCRRSTSTACSSGGSWVRSSCAGS
jgi:hypothetical protein